VQALRELFGLEPEAASRLGEIEAPRGEDAGGARAGAHVTRLDSRRPRASGEVGRGKPDRRAP
jgi:hypothetical protein